MVFLDIRNIQTTPPCRKQENKHIGPFKVMQKVGTRAYELNLPAAMQQSTKVFHVSLLEPARNDPLPGQINPPHLRLFWVITRSGKWRPSLTYEYATVPYNIVLSGGVIMTPHGSRGTISGIMHSWSLTITNTQAGQERCQMMRSRQMAMKTV